MQKYRVRNTNNLNKWNYFIFKTGKMRILHLNSRNLFKTPTLICPVIKQSKYDLSPLCIEVECQRKYNTLM